MCRQLNGEYGSNNVYAGVPVIIGKDGVEKIEEIDLDEKRKKNLFILLMQLKLFGKQHLKLILIFQIIMNIHEHQAKQILKNMEQ